MPTWYEHEDPSLSWTRRKNTIEKALSTNFLFQITGLHLVLMTYLDFTGYDYYG